MLPAVDLNKALAPEAERDSLELASQEREGYTDLLSDQGDLLRNTGNTRLALHSYRAWRAVAAARVSIGDVLLLQSDLAAALDL